MPKVIEFKNAYYIKLGSGGKYEKRSIQENKLRFGWDSWPDEEIDLRNWEKIRSSHLHEYKTPGAATADVNALKTILESTSDDIWITFHAGKLWWCRVESAEIFKDELSRYRKIIGKWNDCDINGNALISNQIPGSISKTQGFRATICKVKAIDDLRRLLNNQQSQASKLISETQEILIKEIEEGIKKLHWKDFETLVDLIFRGAGWRRISVNGETMKSVDMELQEPITEDLYQIQVKSTATVNDFEECISNFSPENFRKFYFVVHSPDKKLVNYQDNIDENIELILSDRLARMVVNFGLTDWLLKKIK